MECNHPEAFVSVKNGYRICGICGEIIPEFPMNPPEPSEQPEEAPKPKTRRRKKDAE